MPASKWIPFYDAFLRAHLNRLSVAELAYLLGHSDNCIYYKSRSMGLNRHFRIDWTLERRSLLKELYQDHSNMEMILIFKERWPEYNWTTMVLITAMRRYGLKRTPEQLKYLYQKMQYNVKSAPRRQEPIGTIKWRNTAQMYCIKTDIGWVRYARFRYQQLHGELPAKMCVTYKDGDPTNIADDNLIAVSRNDIAQRACIKGVKGLSDNYIASYLINIKGAATTKEQLLAQPKLLQAAKFKILLQRKIAENK